MHPILKTLLFTPGLTKEDYVRWGLPVIFIGSPGTGKTAVVEATSRACGLICDTQIPSLSEPSDYKGLPYFKEVNLEGKSLTTTDFAVPSWAVQAAKQGSGVVFFDEINSAAPSVQAALLRVILEGKVGDLALPGRVRFVAAMNPVGESAGGWDLALSLANRFGHVFWGKPESDQWVNWLISGGAQKEETQINAFEEEKRVLNLWPEAFAAQKGLFAAFIKARPDLLLKVPTAKDPNASAAWPSPRSIEMSVRAMAGAKIHGLNELHRDTLLEAFVGNGFATELSAFREKADLPDPAAILDGKDLWKTDKKRPDRTMAAFTAMTALVMSPVAQGDKEGEAKNKARTEKLWDLIAQIVGVTGPAEAADVGAISCRALVLGHKISGKVAYKCMSILNPMIEAADVAGSAY